jgi:hypothetical protein
MGRKGGRSAISGRFVKKPTVRANPKTTTTERLGGGGPGIRFRSAVTGCYVTPSYAARHPATTVRET